MTTKSLEDAINEITGNYFITRDAQIAQKEVRMTAKANTEWQDTDGGFAGESKKATDMQVGEVLTGKITDIQPHRDYENSYFIFLDTAAEGAVRLFTAGKLSYKVKDGIIKPGYEVRIERLADLPAKTKGKKGMTNFDVKIKTSSKQAVDNLPQVG